MTPRCSFEGCSRPRKARSAYCAAHEQRKRRTGDAGRARCQKCADTFEWTETGRPPGLCDRCVVLCAVGGCEGLRVLDKKRDHLARLCPAHRERKRKYGDPLKRRCFTCRRIARDVLTGHVVRSGSWTCLRCLAGARGNHCRVRLTEERLVELGHALARVPRQARLRRALAKLCGMLTSTRASERVRRTIQTALEAGL